MSKPNATLVAVPMSLAAALPSAWLSPAEAERASAYDAGTPRARFVAGRLGVRFALAAHLGPSAVADPGRIELAGICPRCGPSAHGRPVARWDTETLPLSLSYSRAGLADAAGTVQGLDDDQESASHRGSAGVQGWILVGIAPAQTSIGVDLCAPIDEWEGIFDERQLAILRLLPDTLRAREAARRWALIEARGKAAGLGIVPAPHHPLPPATDSVPAEADAPAEPDREWAGSLSALGTRLAATGTEAEASVLPQLRAAVVLTARPAPEDTVTLP